MAVVYKPFNSSAQTKELVAFSVAEALTQQWIGNMITPASWKYFWIITGLSNYFKFYLVDKVIDSRNLIQELFPILQNYRNLYAVFSCTLSGTYGTER